MFSLRRPIFRILGVVFVIAGLGMAAFIAAYLTNDYEKILSGERAEAVVLEANDGGKPVVEFRTKQNQRILIEGKISASPTPYRVGERIGVFYDPSDPYDALIDAFIERWFLPLLFGGFGAVFLVVGSIMFSLARRSARRLERLQREGHRFDGHIVGFEQNQFTKINGRRPWQVLVTWTDGQGVGHSLHSDMLRDDPAQRFKIGDRVTVLVDPADSNTAWVDLFGQSASFGRTGGGIGKTHPSFGKTSTPVVRR